MSLATAQLPECEHVPEDEALSSLPAGHGTMPPPWVLLGVREKLGRLAIMDQHSPLALRSKERMDLGGGDLRDLQAFCDRMIDAGIYIVQLNPQNDTGDHPCNYLAQGLFSFDPSVTCLDDVRPFREHPDAERLQQEHADFIKSQRDYDPLRFSHNHVREFKLEALSIAYDALGQYPQDFADFHAFLRSASPHVKSYALFVALSDHFGHREWWKWPEPFRSTPVDELIEEYESAMDTIGDAMRFQMYVQHVLTQQWSGVSKHVEDRGGMLMMDKAIYPHYGSADVWAQKDLFHVHPQTFEQTIKAGCYFENDPLGRQIWGNAVYRWQENSDAVIDFFMETIRHMTTIAKVIRLDHAMALVWKYYCIDAHDVSKGHHQEALKERILVRLKKEFPDVLFIAEDTGPIGDDQRPFALLHELGFPGMRCPAWGILQDGTIEANNAWVSGYKRMTQTFTDNHDTKTPQEWWESLSSAAKAVHVRQMRERLNLHPDHPLEEAIASTRSYAEMLMKCDAMLAGMTTRFYLKDPRSYNMPGVEHPDNWSARHPEAIEDIDTGELERMLIRTARHRFELSLDGKGHLTADPFAGSVLHLRANEPLVIRASLAPGDDMPTRIEVQSDSDVLIPSDHVETGVQPVVHLDIPGHHVQVQEYQGGWKALTISVPVRSTVGRHTLHVRSVYADQTTAPLRQEPYVLEMAQG